MRNNKYYIIYCVICGLLYLVVVLAWAGLWHLDFVKDALLQMKQISDDMVKRREFYWLSQLMLVGACIGTGIFIFAFTSLDKYILGPRPKMTKEMKQKSTIEVVVSILVLGLISGRSLSYNLYITPIFIFIIALAWFVLYLHNRIKLSL